MSVVVPRVGVLIVGHGSRVAGANCEFEQLVQRFAAAAPDVVVGFGYVELAQPALLDALRALAAQVERVIVAPAFLFAAGHVKNDLPLAVARVRRELPGVRFDIARALGVSARLASVMFDRVCAAPGYDPATPDSTAVLVVGRGSSDPDANADFCKLVRLFGEARGFAWVMPCFFGITDPRFDDGIELLARTRPKRIVVLPYFLFGGRLVDRLSERIAAFRAGHPWVSVSLAAHLGLDDALLDVLHDRVRDAADGAAPLPCDTCQYRLPVGGVVDRVGGLQALLWSVRHALTHSQAMPHEHAHKPLRKHVLVCGNVDCAAKGSIPLLSSLRRLVKQAGRQTDIRITKTACLGRCGEGPTVSVYPDGVWYRGVRETDARELVEQHLLADRLVARLVDDIMQ